MNPWTFLLLGLFAIGATAQTPMVWDDREHEWVNLAEFSRRYASLGPGALRLSQTGPTAPAFTADLGLLRDRPRPAPVQRGFDLSPGPVLIRGRVYDSPHTR